MRWSVIGVGTAGRARAAAIRSDKRSELVAVHRGRHADEFGVPMLPTFAEAVDAADGVAIASPTALHADQVRAALLRGRHVIVEFPLAEDPGTAEALFALARKSGRILHEEHIELLDPPATTLASHVRPELVEAATVTFQGGGAPGATAPELAVANVARLHRLVACCGPVVGVRSVEHQPGRLDAELELASGAVARATFERAPYYTRKTTLTVVSGGRTWSQTNDLLERNGAPVTLIGQGSLFATDQRRAMGRILDGTASYVSEARILHVLDIVARIGAGTAGSMPQRSDASAAP